jgi:hypothetical protein
MAIDPPDSIVQQTIFDPAASQPMIEDPKQADTSNLMSRATTASGHEEAADVYNSTRMLLDRTGRLLYIGDSATLSYLQLMRMIVENTSGPSAFTLDPMRHRIVENTSSLPANFRHTHLLPDKETAKLLVEAYFLNTIGVIEIFHRRSFMTNLENCYSDPLSVDPSWLCLLYLTFAIGIIMAAPQAGSSEEAMIQKLRADPLDRAEMFYLNAKSLVDPMSGFEDAGFWSIQALCLMTVYMLAISKRNTAYAYYGMAVRSAFALGLHREETMVIFSPEEQTVRRNLWRTLFVLDRFLSASLGRPTAISEEFCSGKALAVPDYVPNPAESDITQLGCQALEASVKSSHVIGNILRKVYSKRKVSAKLAHEIADSCKNWTKTLNPNLHFQQAIGAAPNQGVAILHANLFYCHSLILLTRPFFLNLVNKVQQEILSGGPRKHRGATRTERLSEACVIASCHSIVLVQNAFEGRYLPHRNPFVM